MNWFKCPDIKILTVACSVEFLDFFITRGKVLEEGRAEYNPKQMRLDKIDWTVQNNDNSIL